MLALVAGIAAHGVAGAVAYTCVSTAWYSAGVALALRGLPPPAARPELASTPPGGLLRLALGRVAKAYALAFAASQLSTPWRAAAAAALVPFVSLFLSRTRRLLGASSLLPAALLALAAAVGLFTAAMAALIAREVALLRSLPASEPQPPEAGGAPRGGQAAEVRALDGVQAALRSTAAWRSDERIPTETWRRFVVYNAEAAIRDLGVADGPGGQFSLVVDRSSSGVRNQDPALAIAVLPALVQHYPGLLGEVIVAPVNGVFWAVWRVVSLFLAEETTRRFTFIRGARWREALLEAVGGDVELPEHMRPAGDGV
ncbi:hypothetical protein EMIHUDRAFT_224443 [Emiliania huxleyi CCMP1516]|uniref:CRAL-TRIO domain-containing protein n=2 Tax=Emiliania huxleyi TaxID=2903 RepID=A0A0D3KSB1_EMIH1|nr:hypothetical protein EMIHUDRAFT_224443 [Emiliania huxleyi CCMP1516]EOD38646.1 hypothetical protein EMIHUDRAFT_224443 [Emiliania huxleyi CCMP1516]|eukprot:XP_005791075.1 hypothetical protein EMIHUDRAFT_224443 [Emiliania huxleyi CCMP1516]